MKKIFSLFAALIMAATMSTAFGTTYTVSKSINDEDMYKNYADGQQISPIYNKEFSISVNKDGNNGKIYGGDTWRLYEKDEAAMTIQANNGNYLGMVTLYYTATNNATLTYGGRTIMSGLPIFAGDNKTMIFRVKGNGENGQIRITKFSVLYDDEEPPICIFGKPSADGDTLLVMYDLYSSAWESKGQIPFTEWWKNSYSSWREGFKVIKIHSALKSAVPLSMKSMFDSFDNVTTIIGMENLNSSEVTNMQAMFAESPKLKSVDLSHLDMSRVTDMSNMFYGTESLTSIDFSACNVESVTTMKQMFYACRKLKTVIFGKKFKTDKVTDMSYMFQSCESLEALDLSNFDTKKVTTMQNMFASCKSLPMLDLRNIYTTAVTNTSYMFSGCSSLREILFKGNMSKQDNITNSLNMFQNCSVLTGENGTTIEGNPLDKSYARPDQGPTSESPGYFSKTPREIYGKYTSDEDGHVLVIYYDRNKTDGDYTIDEWTSSSTVKNFTKRVIFDESMKYARPTSTSGWFFEFEVLTGFDHLEYLNTSAVTDMSDMFFDCKSLEELDLRTFDFTCVVNTNDMFGDCSALNVIYCATDFRELPNLFTSDNMFNGCNSLEGGEGSKVEDGYFDADFAHVDDAEDPGYFTAEPKPVYYAALADDGKTMTFYYDINIKKNNGNSSWIFDEKYGGFSDEQREAVQTIVIDASLKGGKPAFMGFWFHGFTNAEKIEHLDYINTEDVQNMMSLFDGCQHLVNLDLSSFNTKNVVSMSSMFNDCKELRLINFGNNFKTDKVADMSYMFNGCLSLKRLDLNNFNTANVTDMSYMFSYCEELNRLDINHFDVSKVENMDAMFKQCYNLEFISCYSNDWAEMATNLTSSDKMFDDCWSIVGEKETTYSDDNSNDIHFAHYDAQGNPGYFRMSPLTQIYGVLDEDSTLTIHYNANIVANQGYTPNEWYEAEIDGGLFAKSVNKVVFLKEVKDATPYTTKEWFYNFMNLKEVEHLEYLNTEKTINTSLMFAGCTGLKEIDLRTLDMSNAFNMQGMFLGCTSVESIDLPEKINLNAADMSYLFFGCSALKAIYSNADFTEQADKINEKDNIFYGCAKLVGGEGTEYEMTHVGIEYARPDGGTEAPGYFTKRYTVTFSKWDSQTDNYEDFYVQQVHPGAHATAPSVPSITGYNFKGWKVTIGGETGEDVYTSEQVNTTLEITGETTCVTVYEPVQTTVTFRYLDTDGVTELSKDITAYYGQPINFGDFTEESLPKPEGKHFSTWMWQFWFNEGTVSYEDLATEPWTSTINWEFIAVYAPNQYTVTFKYLDSDGETWKENNQTIEHSKTATAPEVPIITGMSFLGWKEKDGDGSTLSTNIVNALAIKKATEFTAQYEKTTFTVRFFDKDDNLISSQTVEYDKAAVAPETPVWEGHTFTGWSAAFDHVKSDLDIKPVYDVQTYAVTFIGFNGVELKKENVEYGKAATAPDAPAVTGYTFKGWDKKFDNITADLTVTAQYEINKYTVSFVDYDGKELKKETVEYGKSATAPADPTREGYTFTGWDKKFDNITADLTVTAQYEQQAATTHTVTFIDWDGTTLLSEKVEDGKDAKGPENNPTREGYTFTGWSKPITNVTADLIVVAQYEEMPDYTPKNLGVMLESTGDDDLLITLSWDKVAGVLTYELQVMLGDKVLYQSNTFGKNVISVKLSEIQKEAKIAPGAYSIDWSVRSTDAMGTAISDWAKGKSFDITVKDPATGIDNVQSDNVQSTKVLLNGHLYILRGDKMYDVTGKKLK